jgi:hypothetical protein
MPTRYLARVLGLWIVLTELGMVANRQTTVDALNAIFADSALMWVTGVFTMLVGLMIVVAHNRWSGSPATIIVTLYGWIATIKGLTFVWLPMRAQRDFYQMLQFPRFFYAYFVLGLVLGGYLIYAGFRSPASK